MPRFTTRAFAVLVALALLQPLGYFFFLPETVATHFDAVGRANGWMTRGQHTTLHLIVVLFISGLLEGIARLNRHLPDEYINLPHRAQWLSPAHREETLAQLTRMMRAIACAVLLFFIGLFHQVYRANTGSGTLTISTALLSLAFLLSTALIVGTSLLRFRHPPGS